MAPTDHVTASRVPPAIEARRFGWEVDELRGHSSIRLVRRQLAVHRELGHGVIGTAFG